MSVLVGFFFFCFLFLVGCLVELTSVNDGDITERLYHSVVETSGNAELHRFADHLSISSGVEIVPDPGQGGSRSWGICQFKRLLGFLQRFYLLRCFLLPRSSLFLRLGLLGLLDDFGGAQDGGGETGRAARL